MKDIRVVFFVFILMIMVVPCDLFAQTPTPASPYIRIEILTDYYPQDTTWELIERGVGQLASAGPLNLQLTLHIWDVSISTSSCYDFYIYDSYGDGILAPGYYEVYYLGVLTGSGSAFGSVDSVLDMGICPTTPTPTPTPTDTPLPTYTPDPTYTPLCINHGDVNFDGSHTAGDAQLCFSIVLGVYSPTYVEECAADCDGGGSVTAGDAQTIFAVALGLGECIDLNSPRTVQNTG